MAWIWSDDLAAAAEAAGVEHMDLASWKHRPVAFAAGSDHPTPALARQLLGLGPADDSIEEIPPAPCTCASAPDTMLAVGSADG